ncbi:hypothetical protein GCM10028798_25390 [Humibacter antri]
MSTGVRRDGDRNRRATGLRVRVLLLDLSILALTTGIGAVCVKLLWRGFTYWGDNAESFLPLWHMWGSAIRQGQPFLFDHNGWGAANMVGEAAYELFNPVTAANAVFISFFDNLNVAGFFVAVETMVLLGWGIYGVARSYGARRAAALIVGCVAPFAGFTLFYEAGDWLTGLLSIVWTMHFWWAAHNFARRRIGPIVPFVFGALAALLGSPYATIGVVVVLVSVGFEVLLRRDIRRFAGLVAVGAAVGAVLVLAYVALIYALPYTVREVSGQFFSNDNYLTPTLSDMSAFSAPTYLPRFNAWFNRGDFVPSTYLSWFVLPVVPWLRYGVLREWRRLFSLYALGGIYLLLTLGPDQVWLFRWPLRFLEYLYAAVFVLMGVLLSRGFDRRHARLKGILTVVIVAAGAYMSWSSTPNPGHFVAAGLVLALMVVLAFAYRRWKLHGAAAVIVVGTIVFAAAQGSLYGWNRQNVTAAADQPPPTSLSTVREAGRSFEGRVLQIADLASLRGTGAVASGALSFGNVRAAAGINSINRYTGIDFLKFANAMGLDYRGSVAQGVPLSNFFGSVAPRIHVPVVDALGVDTVVVAKNRSDIADLSRLARGWHVRSETPWSVVLVRDRPLSHPVLHAIGDVDISDARENGEDLSFRVTSTSGGSALVDRLPWPGYTASIGDTPLKIEQGPFGLMTVGIPAGVEGTVEIRHAVPGLGLGLASAGAGMLAMVLYQFVYVLRSRRGEDVPESSALEGLDAESPIFGTEPVPGGGFPSAVDGGSGRGGDPHASA